MSEEKTGIEEGEICNRDGCKGEMEIAYDDDLSCSCHIKTPCPICVDSFLQCNKCYFEVEEE